MTIPSTIAMVDALYLMHTLCPSWLGISGTGKITIWWATRNSRVLEITCPNVILFIFVGVDSLLWVVAKKGRR